MHKLVLCAPEIVPCNFHNETHPCRESKYLMKIDPYLVFGIGKMFWREYLVEKDHVIVRRKIFKQSRRVPLRRATIEMPFNLGLPFGDIEIVSGDTKDTLRNINRREQIYAALARAAQGLDPDPLGHLDNASHPSKSAGRHSTVTGPEERRLKFITEVRKTRKVSMTMPGAPRSTVGPSDISVPGRWVNNGDGTATCLTLGTMWIRAPWGCVWNGERFVEEPISLRWSVATELFGRGVRVLGEERSGVLSPSDQRKAALFNGYTRGSCRVEFAGYDDWRLPTADELAAIGSPSIASACDWYEAIFENLTPGEPMWPSMKRLWSANARDNKSLFAEAVAWCCFPADGGRLVDIPDSITHHIVFVRKV
jgi:hypothetical protein